MTEISIKVLPKNLPESITVDLAALEIGQAIHLSELKLPKGCSLQKPITDENDPVIVSIHAPKVVAEVEPEDIESDSVEATTEEDTKEAAE